MTIRDVLCAPKTIVRERVRRKPKKAASRDVDIPVAVDLPSGSVDLFVRVNTRLIENFSIGLRYHPPRGRSSVILRWNGDHGGNAHGDASNRPHVHLPTDKEMDTVPIPIWKEGPPTLALPLPDEGRALIWAWRRFLVAVRIKSNDKVDAAIERLYSGEDLTDDLFETR